MNLYLESTRLTVTVKITLIIKLIESNLKSELSEIESFKPQAHVPFNEQEVLKSFLNCVFTLFIFNKKFRNFSIKPTPKFAAYYLRL